MSSIIDQEIADVRNKCTAQIEGSEVITCHPAQVRVQIKKTKYKNLVVCLQFPEDYPNEPIIIEIKSKKLPDRLCDGLTNIADAEAKKSLGKPHILHILQFVRKFLDDNPFTVCSEELAFIKRELITDQDEIKQKYKAGMIIMNLRVAEYFVKLKCTIPDEYPAIQISVNIGECNFPNLFKTMLVAQGIEMARQCVQKPLRKPKPKQCEVGYNCLCDRLKMWELLQNPSLVKLHTVLKKVVVNYSFPLARRRQNKKDPPFEPKPSLRFVVEYLIKDCIRRFPILPCPVCKERAFPKKPEHVINDPKSGRHVEWMYCGHVFHNGCVDAYMKIPPFTGGKKCPDCGKRIYHDKWNISPQLSEDRWAHQQARQRELDEVTEFLS